MSDGFKVIETQEQFDEAIKDRLNRANSKHQAELDELKSKIADYDALKTKVSDYETKLAGVDGEAKKRTDRIAELEKAISERDVKINGLVLDRARDSAVREFNLPEEMAERLAGATAEEIHADAEKLSKVFSSLAPKAPSFNPEQISGNVADAAYREMVKSLITKG